MSLKVHENQDVQRRHHDRYTRLTSHDECGSARLGVWVCNFRLGPQWVKGQVKDRLGPHLENGECQQRHIDHLRPVRAHPVEEGIQNPEETQPPEIDESFTRTPQRTGTPIVDNVRPNQQLSVSLPVKEPLELQAATDSSSAATPTAVSYHPSCFCQPPGSMYAQLDGGGDVVFDITYFMKYTLCVYYYMYVALRMSEVHVYVFLYCPCP